MSPANLLKVKKKISHQETLLLVLFSRQIWHQISLED